jgi:hypothetical protein
MFSTLRLALTIAVACALALLGCADPSALMTKGAGTAADAGALCGDGIVQSEEECDPGYHEHVVVSDGSRGLPAGAPYDEWCCNPQSCKRRYLYTPCSTVGWNAENCPEGFCDGRSCQPLDRDSCAAWGIDNPIVRCRIDGRWEGVCGFDRCFARCEGDADCPRDSVCSALYEGLAEKVCQSMRPEG